MQEHHFEQSPLPPNSSGRGRAHTASCCSLLLPRCSSAPRPHNSGEGRSSWLLPPPRQPLPPRGHPSDNRGGGVRRHAAAATPVPPRSRGGTPCWGARKKKARRPPPRRRRPSQPAQSLSRRRGEPPSRTGPQAEEEKASANSSPALRDAGSSSIRPTEKPSRASRSFVSWYSSRLGLWPTLT